MCDVAPSIQIGNRDLVARFDEPLITHLVLK